MSGHRRWSEIRHKRDLCLDKSPTTETLCQLKDGHAGNHQDASGNIRWGSWPAYGDFPESPKFSDDVGDEHVDPKPKFNVGDPVLFNHFYPAEPARVIEPTGEWLDNLSPGEILIEVEGGSRYYAHPEELERVSQFPRPEMQEIGKSPGASEFTRREMEMMRRNAQLPIKRCAISYEHPAHEWNSPLDGERYECMGEMPAVYGHQPPVASGPPPTQPPPKPADSARSVTPPRHRRSPLVDKRDREQVEAMLRHTRPLVDQDDSSNYHRLMKEIGAATDKTDHLYPYQTEAVEQIEEGVEALNRIIREQHKKLGEYIDTMAVQYEMYGDPEELVKRAEKAEALLASCKVDLHNSKQHQLGLMCAEQTDKLDKIKRLAELAADRNTGDVNWFANDILDIIEGNDE
jgi:hypothetical protein